MAQGGPISTALNKCISLVRNSTIGTKRAVVPQLDSALRHGVGFASRAAAADAVSTMCATSPEAFKSNELNDTTTNSTCTRLLRALYFASERERGVSARERMSYALGNLSSLAPSAAVRILVVKACEKYESSMGANDDVQARRAAAAAIRAIAVRASSQFQDGGVNNVWAAKVLPLAFIGQYDIDEKVSAQWKDVWSEGGTAVSRNNCMWDEDKVGVLLQEKLVDKLVDSAIRALKDVSWARRRGACLALKALAELHVLAPASRAVGRTTKLNTSELERSKRRALASGKAIVALVRGVKGRLWEGKADLLEAIVAIAGKWITVSSTNFEDLGWDCEGICPWKFITLVGNEGNIQAQDLFVGDDYFLVVDADAAVSEEKSDKAELVVGDGDEENSGGAEVKGKLDMEAEDDEMDVVATVASASPAQTETETVSPILTFSGLCRLLSHQSSIESSVSFALPYKVSTLTCLAKLLESTKVEKKTASEDESMFAEKLYVFLLPLLGIDKFIYPTNSVSNPEEVDGSTEVKVVKKLPPPVIQAKSITVLSMMVHSILLHKQ